MLRTREEFLAGGGNPDEYERFREISDKIKRVFKQQLEDGKYTACTAGFFYVIKGRKPK